jgi:hypothetical protein
MKFMTCGKCGEMREEPQMTVEGVCETCDRGVTGRGRRRGRGACPRCGAVKTRALDGVWECLC